MKAPVLQGTGNKDQRAREPGCLTTPRIAAPAVDMRLLIMRTSLPEPSIGTVRRATTGISRCDSPPPRGKPVGQKGRTPHWHFCRVRGSEPAGDREPLVRHRVPPSAHLENPRSGSLPCPSSNGFDSGASRSRGFSCVQRPHNLPDVIEHPSGYPPTAFLREGSVPEMTRLVNAAAMWQFGEGANIRVSLKYDGRSPDIYLTRAILSCGSWPTR